MILTTILHTLHLLFETKFIYKSGVQIYEEKENPEDKRHACT